MRTKFSVFTSKNVIKILSIKLGEYSGQYLNADDALIELKKWWKKYRAAKKIVGELRKTIQQVIISKLAVDCKVTPEVIQKMMIREEKAKREVQDLRQLRGRNNKSPVLSESSSQGLSYSDYYNN